MNRRTASSTVSASNEWKVTADVPVTGLPLSSVRCLCSIVKRIRWEPTVFRGALRLAISMQNSLFYTHFNEAGMSDERVLKEEAPVIGRIELRELDRPEPL